jgi:signal transduction histidine kinase
MNYAAVFFLEFIIDWISYIQPLEDLNITSWNPQVALHLVFLLNSRANFFPIVIAGVSANILLRSADIFSIGNIEAIATVIIYFGGMLFFRKFFSTLRVFKESAEFLKFIVFSLAIASIRGITSTGLYLVGGEIESDQIIRSIISIIIGDCSGLIIFAPILILLYVDGIKETLKSVFSDWTVVFTTIVFSAFFYALAISPLDNALRFIYLIIVPICFVAFSFKIRNVLTLVVIAQFMLAAAFMYRNSPYYRVMEIQLMILIISSVVIYVSLIIIERREFEARARMIETSRNLATISGIILHEIAQPITALSTYSQIQLNALDSESELERIKLKSYAKNINDEIARVRDLFIKIRGSIKTDTESISHITNVIETMKSIYKLIQPYANANAVKVKLNVTDEEIYFLSMPQNFSIAFKNLLINAVQSASKSEIKECVIQLHQTYDLCFIDFSDSGEMISRENINNIFDYGFSGSIKGLGIGLSIAKDLIEISGGKIIVYPNQRLKFRIVLPKAHAPQKHN